MEVLREHLGPLCEVCGHEAFLVHQICSDCLEIAVVSCFYHMANHNNDICNTEIHQLFFVCWPPLAEL